MKLGFAFSGPFKTDNLAFNFTLAVFAVGQNPSATVLVPPAVSVWFQACLILSNPGAFVFLLSYHGAVIRSRVTDVCFYVHCMP